MTTGSLYETDPATLEVRVYDHDRLLTREHCEAEEDAAAVVERWSDVANLFVVADGISSQHEPDRILAPEAPVGGTAADHPLASALLPGCGTE